MKKVSYFFNLLIINLAMINIPISEAKFASNGFLVEEKTLDFSKTIRNGECRGVVPYPYLSHEDEEIIMEINDEIHDFVELYAICNQDERADYAVKFDLPEAGTRKKFSIRWLTKKHGKIWRIDVLNFHRATGQLVQAEDIFNLLSNNLMNELVKLSQKHLAADCSWSEFLEKIEQRKIQLYLRNKKWFIIFNPSNTQEGLIEQELPAYFLKDTKYDRG